MVDLTPSITRPTSLRVNFGPHRETARDWYENLRHDLPDGRILADVVPYDEIDDDVAAHGSAMQLAKEYAAVAKTMEGLFLKAIDAHARGALEECRAALAECYNAEMAASGDWAATLDLSYELLEQEDA